MPDARLLVLFVCGVMVAFALLWACCAISARCEDGDGWRHAGVE